MPRKAMRAASNNIATTRIVSGTMNTATWVSGWVARLAAVAGETPAIMAATEPRATRTVEAMA